jgi:hypothetical protein
MNNVNYLPRKDADFLQRTVNFLAVLVKIFERIGFPTAVYQQLLELKNRFDDKLRIAEAPETRTKPAVRDKNDARQSLETSLRQAIREYLTNNHLLTDADRDSLGLPVYKTTRTPAPVADKAPDAEADTSTMAHLAIHFYEAGGKHKKAKPAGQHGAEIGWIISDTPPARWDELTHSAIDTNSPFTLAFEHDQRGKTVYFALRWENTRGEKGPWSEIMNAIIP